MTRTNRVSWFVLIPALLLPTMPRLASALSLQDTRELYMMDADGTNVGRLTNHEGGVESPTWSPDGKQIAHVCRGEIYTVNADGTNATLRITGKKTLIGGRQAGWVVSHFVWSPEGKRALFVFTDKDGKHELWIANIESPGHADISSVRENSSAPTWSPNGQTITFEGRDEYGESRVFLWDIDSRDSPKRISSALVEARNPVWSPDGKRIAYTSLAGELYVIEAAWLQESKVTDQRVQGDRLSWSPDGTQLAFASKANGGSEIYVLSLNGSSIRKLTNLGHAGHPVWSPDGTQIVFLADGSLFVMNADGAMVRQVSEDDLICSDPAWSPDGRTIVFVAMPGRIRLRAFEKHF